MGSIFQPSEMAAYIKALREQNAITIHATVPLSPSPPIRPIALWVLIKGLKLISRKIKLKETSLTAPSSDMFSSLLPL